LTAYTRIGCNCMILNDVTVGITNGLYKGPRIGNNVYIGTGAKIIGDIFIADGVCVGANAVVVKSIEEKNITVGGIPATKISDKGSSAFLVPATELVQRQGK